MNLGVSEYVVLRETALIARFSNSATNGLVLDWKKMTSKTRPRTPSFLALTQYAFDSWEEHCEIIVS